MKMKTILGCLFLAIALYGIPKFFQNIPSLTKVSPSQLFQFHAWTLHLAVFSFVGTYLLLSRKNSRSNVETSNAPVPFARRAGQWSMIAVFMVILLSWLAVTFPNRIGQYLQDGAFVVVVFGLALAVISLGGVKYHGAQHILGNGITGLVSNGLILWMLISYSWVERRWEENQAAYRENIQEALNIQGEIKETWQGGYLTSREDKKLQLERFTTSLKKASEYIPAEDSAAMRGWASFMSASQSHVLQIDESMRVMGALSTNLPIAITSTSKLQKLEQTLSSVLTRLAQSRQYWMQAEQELKTKLRDQKLDPTAVRDAFRKLHSDLRKLKSSMLLLLDASERYGRDLMQIVDFLKVNIHGIQNPLSNAELDQVFEQLMAKLEASALHLEKVGNDLRNKSATNINRQLY